MSVHDKAVLDIARLRFDNFKYDVYTNPGSEKNAYINANAPTDREYPDILVLELGQGTRNLITIGEVETEESITKEESEQWRKYSAHSCPFYLFIPSGCVAKTKLIMHDEGISVTGIRTYHYDDNGDLIVLNVP